MRIGLLGGSFDPIHLGHLILAERCREEAKLDEIWFLPSYVPPHKADRSLTRFEQRGEMVTLAITGQPAFRLDLIEKELPTPSYTAETLAELHHRHPENQFAFIIGGDSLVDLPRWHDPRRILQLAQLLVVARPGATHPELNQIAEQLQMSAAEMPISFIESPLIDIASRDIRRRVAEGRTIRFLVPRSVEEYIRERKLYRG